MQWTGTGTRGRQGFALLAAVTLGGTLLTPAVGRGQEPAAEHGSIRALEQHLERLIAPAERWKVTVDATPAELASGRLRHMEATGTNVHLPDGLEVASVQLSLDNLQVHPEHGLIAVETHGQFIARMRAEDMARVIEENSEGKLRRVRVEFQGDRLVLHCRARAGGMNFGLVRRSHPTIEENEVHGHTLRLSVAGVRLPKSFLRRVDRKMNPIFTMKKLPIPVVLRKLGVEKDAFVIEATVDFSAALPRPSAGAGG